MSREKKDKYRLTELHKSDFEMADGEPDIRGWKVKNTQGQIIGEVIELLFDPLSRSVRYLIVHIEGKALNLVSRNVLIPIGLADIHDEFDDVILPNVTVGQLASLPTYKRNTVSPIVERSVRNVFLDEPVAPVATETVADETPDSDRFYQHEHFDEDRMFKRRSKRVNDQNIPVVEEQVHTASGKRIVPKSITKENQTITNAPLPGNTSIRKEEVRADHYPVDQPGQEHFAPFQEGAIELTEHKEVPVVSKEARVVEEVSVNKDIDHHDETIHDTIRRSEVDVEEFDKEGRRR